MAAVVGTQELRPQVLPALAVAVCYYAGARLGLLRQVVVENVVVMPIWPPTGVAMAALLVCGLRCWPGITVGALLAVLAVNAPGPDLIGTVAGNTIAPVCALLMLRRVGFRTDLSRLRDGLALVFLAALLAMLVSAVVGSSMLLLTDRLAAPGYWRVCLAWWVGDAMGVLLVTPVLLLPYQARWPPRLGRWREALALALAVCCVVPLAVYSAIGLLFLVYPLLIWSALRFRVAGSTLCALFMSVLVTVAATDYVGSFKGLTPVEVLLKLHAFNGTVALTALLLSAVITEQRNTRRSVEQACQELVEVLENLTMGDAVGRRFTSSARNAGRTSAGPSAGPGAERSPPAQDGG
ncbi:MASE1 domain-containing protein [Streptomyces sp. NPDC102462]|uniref:MASE1 domain-containing protein n=1 Tax=Streptomyces sp. NPDC102462 TaxID=3366178 RepID=UPI003819760E